MKKLITTIVALALCFALSACGSKFNLEEYKSLVSQCSSDIEESGIVLSNIGQFEYAYWSSLNSLGGDADYDKVLSFAKEQLLEKGQINYDTVAASYANICDQYKQIIAVDISGAEAEKIAKNFDDVFTNYNALYLLVTAPDGDISGFVDDFNEYSDNIIKNNSSLSILVSD